MHIEKHFPLPLETFSHFSEKCSPSFGKLFSYLLGNCSLSYWVTFPIPTKTSFSFQLGKSSHPQWETFHIPSGNFYFHWGNLTSSTVKLNDYLGLFEFKTKHAKLSNEKLFPKGLEEGNFSQMIIYDFGKIHPLYII